MITILTPTYNRAYLLPVLYQSLLNQTSKTFEWIIIDDGSTDTTSDLVQSWLTNQDFKIRYFHKPNGGKHTAINLGVNYADYEYVYILDSDDYLTHDAIESAQQWIMSIDQDPNFAGVSGLRADSKGNVIGTFPIRSAFVDATNLEREKYELIGDKAEIYRKDILLAYPFPEYPNERFLPEAVVWDRIARDGYKLRWYNQVICICEYQADGLTMNHSDKFKLDNFLGYTDFEKLNYANGNFVSKILTLSRYYDIARKKGFTISETAHYISIHPLILMSVVLLQRMYRFIGVIK